MLQSSTPSSQATPVPSENLFPDPSPFSTRALSALGCFLMLSFLGFPRFAPCILLGILLGVILIALVRTWQTAGTLPAAIATPAPNLPMAAAYAFLLWSLVACSWSADPAGGLLKVLILSGILVLVRVARPAIEQSHSATITALWHGMIVGLLIGAVYLSIEAVTDRGITKFIYANFEFLRSGYEKHLRIRKGVIVNVSDANINRVTALFTLFLWPALFYIYSALTGRLKWIAIAMLATCVLAMLIYSRHQTSQLAILVSGFVLVLALWDPVATRRLAACGWIAVTALVVPLTLYAFDHRLQTSSELFNTARARVIIWGYTAEQVVKHPVFGVGTNATREIDRRREGTKEKPSGYASALETRAHPHNFYLQVWYELGGVGALLFALLGAAVASAIRYLPPALQPISLAQFTMTAAMIGSSYGLWQAWLQATIAFSIIALLLALKLAWPKYEAGAST